MRKYPNHPIKSCPVCDGEFDGYVHKYTNSIIYDYCVGGCNMFAGCYEKNDGWLSREFGQENIKGVSWIIEKNISYVYCIVNCSQIRIDFPYLPYNITLEQLKKYLAFI